MPFCLFIVRIFVFSGCLDESIVLLVSLVFSLCRRLSINVTLPAVAAERRAAAPLLRSAPIQLVRGAGARSCRSIFPAHRALSSKPASHRCCWGQTDKRTDEWTLDR